MTVILTDGTEYINVRRVWKSELHHRRLEIVLDDFTVKLANPYEINEVRP